MKRKFLGKMTTLVPAVENVPRWQERSASMYVPKPVDVPLAQFVAQDEAISTRILEDPRLAWREVCGSEFHVHPVRGSHGTLLGEPHAGELARRLRELLASGKKALGAGA
jgi:thioesterase domain-containing protein